LHLLHEPRDADGEELVEAGRDDRAQLHALEEGYLGVARELEDALVEFEPRELAVQEPLGVRGDGAYRLDSGVDDLARCRGDDYSPS
jgi:hypothetical protein